MDSATTNTSALLAAVSISKSFGDRQVLSNVNLEIHPSQVVTLIGPNGAGKTTLVRILLDLLRPDSGKLHRRDQLSIGYMPQHMHIDNTMPLTVERFLRLAGDVDRERMATSLEQLQISHLGQQQLHSISGGETQRVLLARALLRNPDLLILDEPAQGVDLAGQAELYDLISRIRHEYKCGVLMISHDLHLVMSTTDEVICLNHHVCCQGKPDQVSNDPAYLDLFGAKAARNLAVYTHHHNHEHDIAGGIRQEDD